MTDPNEPLEDKVKRLEAELVRLKVERYRDRFHMRARTQSGKGWEDFTQEDYDAAMWNTGVLEVVIEQLERDSRGN